LVILKITKREAIDGLNDRIRDCQRCRLSRTRKHALAGEGKPDARIMLVALSPGENENAENRMFIGPSGDILDQLFQATGMERGWVYMTNLIKCMLPKCRRPKMDEIDACSVFLYEEISIIQPDIIVPLGYYATRTIMTRYHADPPAARKDFKKKYGILLFSDGQKILPLPHPATLLYDPSFEMETRGKYKKLTTLLHPCRWYALCPMKRFYEAGRLDRRWIELYCMGDWQDCIRYHMAEKGQFHFDWMLPDGSLDENLKDLR
jgi:uracil-DNA glycosylase family 4